LRERLPSPHAFGQADAGHLLHAENPAGMAGFVARRAAIGA